MSDQSDLFKPKLKLADTEDWKLGAFLAWTPIKHIAECTSCGGRGSIGGGFKSFSEEEICPTCYGSKTVTVTPSESTKPKDFPEGLKEHLLKAWIEFFREDHQK